MKFLAALALLAAVALPAGAQETPDWFSESFLDVREDVAEAAKEGKRLALYFWQVGCPYCTQMSEVTFRDARVIQAMKRRFVPVGINIYGAREVTWSDGRKMSEKEFAGFMKIRATPTLVFFDEKGAVARRLVGYLPPDKFVAALD